MKLKRGFGIVKNIIILFAIFVIFMLIMMLFRDYSATIPLRLFFLFIVVQEVLYLCAVFFVKISLLKNDSGVIECGDNIDLEVFVNKKGIYPFKKMEIMVSYKSNYEENIHNEIIKIELSDKMKQRKYIKVPALYCGYVEAEIKNIIVYDILSMFSIKRKIKNEKLQILVMPKVEDILIEKGNIPRLGIDREKAFIHCTEDESKEQYEIREFIPGDSLNSIHWKLTAKEDEFIVRELKNSQKTNIYVYFDLRKNIDINKMYEKSVSAARKLIAENRSFYMVWVEFDSKLFGYTLKRKEVKDMSNLFNGLMWIMKLDLCEDEVKMNDLLSGIRNSDGSVNTIFTL